MIQTPLSALNIKIQPTADSNKVGLIINGAGSKNNETRSLRTLSALLLFVFNKLILKIKK